MAQSEQINELVTALIKAQSGFKPLKRDAVNPFYKSKYATLDNVIDSTSESLRKNGLIVIQTTDGPNIITTLAHTSGQYISGSYPLTPEKDNPQGMGSAFTYARRYTYSAIVQQAPSDEDDDGNSTGTTENEPSGNTPDCPDCGKKLFKDKSSDGFYCWKKKEGCGKTFNADFQAKIDPIEKFNTFWETLPEPVKLYLDPLSMEEKYDFIAKNKWSIEEIELAISIEKKDIKGEDVPDIDVMLDKGDE